MAKKIPKLGGDTTTPTTPGVVDPNAGGNIDTAINDFNSRALIGSKRLDQFRQVVIQAMFKLMKDAGIDPNDLGSINQFLQSLEQMDPDIAELFDVAFNDLIGTTNGQTPASQSEGTSLMDKYSNLAGPALGQGQGLDTSAGSMMSPASTPDMGSGAPDMGAGIPGGLPPAPGGEPSGSMSPNPQIPPVGAPWIGGSPMLPPK